MKPRDYCCCAIPLVNAGIYTLLLEQFVAALLIGILSVGTPEIVGDASPSFASILLGIVAFVACGVQVIGFIAVKTEKTGMFQQYRNLHSVALAALLAIAAAWIIISATGHSKAKTACIDKYFTSDTIEEESDTLCEIFTWVDVGIMGGLWVVLAVSHAYFFVVLNSYVTSMKDFRGKYNALRDSSANPLNDIPMDRRNDPWDSRASVDSVRLGEEPKYGAEPRYSAEPKYGGEPAYGAETQRQPTVLSKRTSTYNQAAVPAPRFPDPYHHEDQPGASRQHADGN
ncbi:hypothetical protein BD626DRAFT_486968 [Schizophyllum amplum]|uniref:MARVEL domain-containing protein n=1 Tax=Schizophyllum amplum TaxID=97359 RepID=A0A550CN68_9AGAR|nr:hypothetical protein BD626DRAFT_486968 [Auriculariopsis ampla]